MRDDQRWLGCQMWIEPDDSLERLRGLFTRAAESGLGWIRLFLMWPWIEETPEQWNFRLFDQAFDVAAEQGILIKATLTANAGPWHIGTPSVLHTLTGFLGSEQREPMRRYIQACVQRYHHHPALGQWILWNEPYGGCERTPETLALWQSWLERFYQGNLAELNHRWRTGYPSFASIPFPEALSHEMHRESIWNSYEPWLADWQFRSTWLAEELTWIRDIVREIDPITPTCFNPAEVFTNHAQNGLDFHALGKISDVMGASYHPVWHFHFADRALFPALMTVGVRMEASVGTVRQVEVTEVQTGNTLNSGAKPAAATPGEIARYYLAGLAAGATSVTGWSLNMRSHQFEAGDWGLLDNMDQASPRSRMLARVHACLQRASTHTGAWSAAPPRAYVVYDPHAQALEWIEARITSPIEGRLAHDGAHGAALLASALTRCGVATTLVQPVDIPLRVTPGDLLVCSHLAWEEGTAQALLRFAEAGGTVLLDATCGRKNLRASMHRPWPGGLAEKIGLRATDLQTRPEGYALQWHGLTVGRGLLTRVMAELADTAGWRAWPHLRFAYDGETCVWERGYGQGRVLVFRGLLGPSLVHVPEVEPVITDLLRTASAASKPDMYPVSGHWSSFTVPVAVEHGRLTAVFSVDPVDRQGLPVHLYAPAGTYLDLWNETSCQVQADQELQLEMPEGIALLWQPDRQAENADRF